MSGNKSSPQMPATPIKKGYPPYIHHHVEGSSPYSEYYQSRGSPDSTIDGESAPATPAVNQFSPPETRRRSNTFSSLNKDSALRSHEIFKLNEKNEPIFQEYGLLNLQDGGNGLFIAGYSPEKRRENHVSFSPVVTTNEDDSHQQQSKDSIEEPGTTASTSELDLAKNGLPSACVFVANLASSQTDEQLLASVEKFFRQFGRLHVKIRRDSKGNPYSFCQFESDEIARLAVTQGRHAIIDETGRRIRCEPAKVNRTLVLSKRDDTVITRDEVDKILFGYGPLEAVEFAAEIGQTPRRNLNHGKRCFVRFVYRQDAVECYQFFRCHQAWSADWTHNFPVAQLVPPTVERIQVQEIDRQSVFVGKLNPNKVTEELLRNRFEKHGAVVEIHLLFKHKQGVGRIAFAFVKYENEDDATKAIESENNTEFLGNFIHCQVREVHKKAPQPTYTSVNHPINSQHPWLRVNPISQDPNRMVYQLSDVANLAGLLCKKLEETGIRPAVVQNVISTPSYSNGYQRELLSRLVQNSLQQTTPKAFENRQAQENKLPEKKAQESPIKKTQEKSFSETSPTHKDQFEQPVGTPTKQTPREAREPLVRRSQLHHQSVPMTSLVPEAFGMNPDIRFYPYAPMYPLAGFQGLSTAHATLSGLQKGDEANSDYYPQHWNAVFGNRYYNDSSSPTEGFGNFFIPGMIPAHHAQHPMLYNRPTMNIDSHHGKNGTPVSKTPVKGN